MAGVYALFSVWHFVEAGKQITCELRSNTASFATACVHFEENIYYVFLEDRMKICTDEVQCFLDTKFPDTKFSHLRD